MRDSACGLSMVGTRGGWCALLGLWRLPLVGLSLLLLGGHVAEVTSEVPALHGRL